MTGPVLLCFDGSDEAAEAIRHAADLLAGREAIVLSVAVPAKDELPLDPMSDLVGRLSGLYVEWDEMCAQNSPTVMPAAAVSSPLRQG